MHGASFIHDVSVVILSVIGLALFIYSLFAFVEILDRDHTPLLRSFLARAIRKCLPSPGYVKLAQMIQKKNPDYTNDVLLNEVDQNYPLIHLGVTAYEAYITAQTILSVGKNYKLSKTVVKTSTDALKRAVRVCETTNDHKMIPELLPKIRKAFESMAASGVSVDEAFVKDIADMLDQYNSVSEERAKDIIEQIQRARVVPDLDSEVKR